MRNVYTLTEHEQKTLVPKAFNENLGTIGKIKRESVQVLNESAKGKPKKLIVTIEAIHVGRTRNYTYYTKEGLSAGLESWTSPRPKPVLTHHNDVDGEPIGRIIKAEYHDVTMSGKPGLMFTVESTDPVAIEKVLDGRYQTVSIGASTDKVTCNICGSDRTQEWCEHYPGQEYEDQTAHFIIGTTYGREVSYVNVPADEYAGNTGVTAVYEDDGSNSNGSSQESVQMNIFQLAEGLLQHVDSPGTNLYEQLNEGQKKAFENLLRFEEGSTTMPNPNEENPETTVTGTKEGEQTPPTEPETTPVAGTKEGEQTPPAPANADPVAQTTESNPPAPATPPTPTVNVTEMQQTITNLVMENQRIGAKLSEAQAEVSRLTQENATLNEAAHRSLAESVVQLKRQLNKPDVVGVDHQEAVDAHAARSKESLENTRTDLLAESKTLKPVPGSVTNPGVHTDESDKPKTMTGQDAVNLFSGMFKSKKH
ncbi:hypothetical protein TCA2_4523 [Paenibacillus sp. TCA20]|uniref:hypothetical protein n=1 Tax=Paenibacillus sp. TCA20 TaxID=1499968 RepID=UPI0004D7A33B|nr:hypothetical protein [Paenibacillus sp. TCA20]GAK42031.1 hypothetical protein TCA2_4523 [Paenibacillus sp. TCA20]